jgi:hypothetical protein
VTAVGCQAVAVAWSPSPCRRQRAQRGWARLLRFFRTVYEGHPPPRARTYRCRTARRTPTSTPAPNRGCSGGNPQTPKGEGDEQVQAYIAAMPGWKRSLGEQLDGLIVRTVPDVRKAVKWNQPFHGHEGEGWFLAFRCHTKYIQQFFRGTSLDPVPPKAPSTTRCVTSTSTTTTTSTRTSSSPGSNRRATCPARSCEAAGHRPRSAFGATTRRSLPAATG